MKVREVITYKDYFDDFFSSQPQKVRDKIIKISEKDAENTSYGNKACCEIDG